MSVGLDEQSGGVDFGAFVDEQELERRSNEWIANALKGILSQIQRTMTMMRVYPKNHPLVDGLVAQVIEKFDPIFEREDDVIVRVDARHLSSEWGHQVLVREEGKGKHDFVWYVAYSDGIVQFEFRKGLVAEELQRFLWIINQAAQGKISSDDDTVTILWEQQFETVKYFAVEGFVDGGSLDNFDQRTEPEAIALVADAAEDLNSKAKRELDEMFNNLNLRHVDLFTRMQIEAQQKIVPPQLRDQDLQYAFSVDIPTLNKMHGEWTAGADLEYRLIEALLSVIRIAPASKGSERASEIIVSVIHQLLDNEMWTGAAKVLNLLNDRRNFFGDSEFDPLQEVLAELSDPMRMDALLNAFQKEAKQREGMMQLLLLLSHDAVQKQILIILSDSKRGVIGIDGLVDLLQATTNDTNARNVWDPEYIDKNVYLRRLLPELADRDFEGWTPTSHLIRAGIAHADPDVKEATLGLNHSCWKDPTLAERYLSPMSVDRDERIRKLSLQLLADHHPTIFRSAIRESLLAKKFMGRSSAELRFLMRVYYESDPGAPEFLRSLLGTWGWFGEGAREFAKMSAAVLIEQEDQQGIQMVEDRSKKFFVSPELKKAFRQSLRRHQRRLAGESSFVSEAMEDKQ